MPTPSSPSSSAPQPIPVPVSTSTSANLSTNSGEHSENSPEKTNSNRVLSDSSNESFDKAADEHKHIETSLASNVVTNPSTNNESKQTNGATSATLINDNLRPQQDHHTAITSSVIMPTTVATTTTTPITATSATINPTTKLNGLKNRIIQRPPPLVLDKVSNFYENNSTSNDLSQLRPQQQQQTNKHSQHNTAAGINGIESNNQGLQDQSQIDANHAQYVSQQQRGQHHYHQQQQQQQQQYQTTDDTVISDRTSSASNNNANNNNANKKFWASLNENASRNKALATARSLSMTTSNDVATSSLSSKDMTDSLGPDLIIKHRNSIGSTQSRASSNRKQSSQNYHHQHQHQNNPTNNNLSKRIYGNHIVESKNQTVSRLQDDRRHHASDELYSRTRAASCTSNELDDGPISAGNGGGNLIGVDNSTTPPATHHDNPPASATSSHSRNNNPFLDDDDETSETKRVSSIDNESNDIETNQTNNFHKRPASFIAATDRLTSVTRTSDLKSQRIIEEKFNELQVTDKQEFATNSNSNSNTNNKDYTITQQHLVRNPTNHHHSNGVALQTQSNYDHFGLSEQQVYGSKYYSQLTKYQEPTISLDSESTICQPPPSATMQLPHWTDAIYELNNAILETSSIAGGAENGQFIYIVENGDIILELDQIKVSGFTLLEFNEHVESKQFHLLKAVQTKHSHGLTSDLKAYLNLSFPKSSKDRQLQMIIRENIYRRTIPCTTRPPKPGEVDKVDYHFLTKEHFIELNKCNMLLEFGVYQDHFYGTLKPLCDISNLPYYSSNYQKEISEFDRQSWDANHPAVEMMIRKDAMQPDVNQCNNNPLYENQQSLQMQQQQQPSELYSLNQQQQLSSADVATSSEPLPPGWERVIDQTHGAYYIDHNTKRTQYERPYEVELTKGSMGFGFTLVEADNGLLLVRSVIPGGPAYSVGSIKPGDILISAVGVSVTGLQHTDVARLFSTFAVGDRVRLTFARSNYPLDDNLVPDEYLFSNGTNGDLAIAVNPNNYSKSNVPHGQNLTTTSSSPHILVNQEFEFAKVTLKRGDQGFGFTISDSIAGQKVRKIQNHDICSNLKQNDILVSLNGQDITKLTHKEVVERLKKCPPGEDVILTVKRKKKFRSKTPMAMHTDQVNGQNSLDSTPQRNCKTPSLDGLMLNRSVDHDPGRMMISSSVARNIFQAPATTVANQNPPLSHNLQLVSQGKDTDYSTTYSSNSGLVQLPILASNNPMSTPEHSQQMQTNYGSLPYQNQQSFLMQQHSIYGSLPMGQQPQPQPLYHNQQNSIICTNTNSELAMSAEPTQFDLNSRLTTASEAVDVYGSQNGDNISNSVHASEVIAPQNASALFPNMPNNEISQVNQYNNFMNNDKLMMMQMHQQQAYQRQLQTSDYHHVPLYSNSEIIMNTNDPTLQTSGIGPSLPIKPSLVDHQSYQIQHDSYKNNFYANNEEIALQGIQQYNYETAGLETSSNGQHLNNPATHDIVPVNEQFNFVHSMSQGVHTPHDEHDEYEYHHVDLIRENTDSNWGIRLIGGAEVDRAISIGSMIFGGVAAKSGKLKSGDEIISIDGVNVVGATHQHVVELISACTNRVLLVVRRKTFAEACDVVLTKNMDEGFGFVIISSENCALIGKIIEGSPADRCKQLRVRDCIIAVNGRYITPDMKHPEIVNMIKECGSTLRLRIIPVDCYTVKLIKDLQNDSFGFRMRGGSEYDGTPLYIVRVEMNGQAHGLLNVGDQILEINNIPTVGMTHSQAATIIKYSDPIVKLKLRRNYVTPPSLLVDSPRALQKYNQVTAEMKTVSQTMTPIPIAGSHEGSTNQLEAGSTINGIEAQQQQLLQQHLHQHQNPFSSLPNDMNAMILSQHQFAPDIQSTTTSISRSDHLVDNHVLENQQIQQPIYGQHSLNYMDQNSLYAS